MLDTAREAGTNSLERLSRGVPHIEPPVLDNQQRHTFIRSVWILDAI